MQENDKILKTKTMGKEHEKAVHAKKESTPSKITHSNENHKLFSPIKWVKIKKLNTLCYKNVRK